MAYALRLPTGPFDPVPWKQSVGRYFPNGVTARLGGRGGATASTTVERKTGATIRRGTSPLRPDFLPGGGPREDRKQAPSLLGVSCAGASDLEGRSEGYLQRLRLRAHVAAQAVISSRQHEGKIGHVGKCAAMQANFDACAAQRWMRSR